MLRRRRWAELFPQADAKRRAGDRASISAHAIPSLAFLPPSQTQPAPAILANLLEDFNLVFFELEALPRAPLEYSREDPRYFLSYSAKPQKCTLTCRNSFLGNRGSFHLLDTLNLSASTFWRFLPFFKPLKEFRYFPNDISLPIRAVGNQLLALRKGEPVISLYE